MRHTSETKPPGAYRMVLHAPGVNSRKNTKTRRRPPCKQLKLPLIRINDHTERKSENGTNRQNMKKLT